MIEAKPTIEALDPATGAVIYTFASMRAVSEAGYKRFTVQRCLDGLLYEYAGLLWRRSGEPVPQPPPPAPPPPLPAPPPHAYLAAFIGENVHEAPGHLLPFGDFYERFLEWLPGDERKSWNRIRVSRALPAWCQSGHGNQNKTYLINAAWEPKPAMAPYSVVRGKVQRAA